MRQPSRILKILGLGSLSWILVTWVLASYPLGGLSPSLPVPKQQPTRVNPKQHSIKQLPQRNANETFSACLLVMDDNHFLIEWLAFHYHALSLRYLIVAIDPRSETSPRDIFDRYRFLHHDPMTIIEWTHDEDYMSEEERTEAEARAYWNFGNVTPALLRHRARQRVFYYKCLKRLKQEGRSWTLMTDTDEFLHINYPFVQQHTQIIPVPPITQPGSVRTLLYAELQRPGNDLWQSPCIQIPRLRFGAYEEPSTINTNNNIPSGWDASRFLTLRYRHHARPNQHWANKISKVFLDVSQVEWSQLVPVDSIHRPIKAFCSQRKLHIQPSESPFVINHYLGSWEAFSYRSNDARIDDARSRKQYDKQAHLAGETSHDIVPWLAGFVASQGEMNAKALLEGVGVLVPKSAGGG